MAILDDIKVQIKLTESGRILTEYNSPKVPANDNDFKIEKFVEAVTDAQFSITVQLSSRFRFFSANGICIACKIDDGSLVDSIRTVRRSEFDEDWEGTKNYCFKRTIVREDYKEIGFAFDGLRINEQLDFEDETIKEHASNQGIIRVKIYRAKIRQSKTRRTSEREEAGARLEEAPTKLVKNNFISHTMKPTKEVLLDSSPFSPKRRNEMNRLSGDQGKTYEFVFRYRSNLGLQLLGCNPIDEFEEADNGIGLRTEPSEAESPTAKQESSVKMEHVKQEPSVAREISSNRVGLGSFDDGDDEIQKLELENDKMEKRIRLSKLRAKNLGLKRRLNAGQNSYTGQKEGSAPTKRFTADGLNRKKDYFTHVED